VLYRQGCDGGDGNGCIRLGKMFEDGDGVTQDKAQALALYRKGCDAADREGCYWLKKLTPK
jgi:TPR repeat protein